MISKQRNNHEEKKMEDLIKKLFGVGLLYVVVIGGLAFFAYRMFF